MNYAAILFDLEGVLLEAKTHKLLPGAREIFAHCAKEQIPYAVISNNTLNQPEKLRALMAERELYIESYQLLTPLQFLCSELKGKEKALVIGSAFLHEFISDLGLECCEVSEVDVVVCGGGFTINNSLLNSAYTAIAERQADFLCLHRNKVFKDSTGIVRPDVGSIVSALEFSTGKQAKTLGKPSSEYFQKAIDAWDLPPQEILLISDDPLSDLGGGKAFGLQTAFVATGKYDTSILEQLEIKPDYVWESLNQGLVAREAKS